MSAKKFDLAKNLGLKIAGRMNAGAAADRFGAAAAESADRREQRRRDAAAGLVPFACKLPADLTRELQQLASTHEGGINGLIAGLLTQALKASPAANGEADEAAAPAAKKTAAKKVASKEAEATEAVKEPAAKKTAAKKTAGKKA